MKHIQIRNSDMAVMKHIQIRNSDMDWHIAANNLG